MKRKHNNQASAMIETAIVMPIYMMVIFAILYFGYATIGLQKQHQAATYVAMMSEEPDVADVNRIFLGSATGDWMGIKAGWQEKDEMGDIHYENDPDAVLPEFTEGNAVHSLSNGEGAKYLFDQERLGIGLSIMAMPKITRSVSLDQNLDVKVTDHASWTDAAKYLNENYTGSDTLNKGNGFIDAPSSFASDNANWTPDVGGSAHEIIWLARGLTGIPTGDVNGNDGDYDNQNSRWLMRRSVVSTLDFNVPWARFFMGSPSEKTTDAEQWETLDYNAPEHALQTKSTITGTRRGQGQRRSIADHDGPDAAGMMSDVGRTFLDFDMAKMADPAIMATELENLYGSDATRLWQPQTLNPPGP